MRRFNVRPISAPVSPPPPIAPSGKLPSAFSKGGHVTGSTAVAAAVAEPEKKKGRPSKEEARRQKMALASEAIAALCSDKPTRAKVRDYFESRIHELDEEKR